MSFLDAVFHGSPFLSFSGSAIFILMLCCEIHSNLIGCLNVFKNQLEVFPFWLETCSEILSPILESFLDVLKGGDVLEGGGRGIPPALERFLGFSPPRFVDAEVNASKTLFKYFVWDI